VWMKAYRVKFWLTDRGPRFVRGNGKLKERFVQRGEKSEKDPGLGWNIKRGETRRICRKYLSSRNIEDKQRNDTISELVFSKQQKEETGGVKH